mgnify:FL=1|tara:strand:+ start:235 stop:897 length:663 start_codon:yes stop_codon:yes gene_type:complete
MSDPIKEFEEMYFKTLYEFYEKNPDAKVRTGDLAEALRVTPASTTEMVQRLAAKGYLEYIPYKGSMLTEKGLVHGRKMKRRYRLAEMLLDHLPFAGNQHVTACRLEHAIDDDLEAALTVYFNNPLVDIHGVRIPDMSQDVEDKILSEGTVLIPLGELDQGVMSTVKLIVASKKLIEHLNGIDIKIDSEICRLSEEEFKVNGQKILLSPTLVEMILISPLT